MSGSNLVACSAQEYVMGDGNVNRNGRTRPRKKKREYIGLRKKYAVEAHEKISLTIHVTVY